MLTRMRFEAVGHQEVEVRKELVEAIAENISWIGNEWEIESEEVQTTKNGFWGRLVIRRKEASHGSEAAGT